MAAPLVAVFMVFVGRDTVPVSNVVNGKKQTTEGVFVVWIRERYPYFGYGDDTLFT